MAFKEKKQTTLMEQVKSNQYTKSHIEIQYILP